MSVLWVVLILVALQRIAELAYARHNTARLLERGGVESGASHYPLFVLLHASWLIAMAVAIAPATTPNWWLLAAYAALQPLRVWTVASLGPYWTTRVVAVPGAPLVARGPYRYVKHPNYLIVCAEIAVLPLAFGAIWIAVTFTVLDALLLWWRIRIENRSLRERS